MPSTEPRTPLLILGLGNLLCEDDGLGVEAVRRLLDGYDVPDGALVLDGGTLGLSLLPHLLDAEAAILVDAIQGEGPPGSSVRLDGDDVGPAAAHRLSPHQVGVADLLDGARLLGRCPARLVLLGLVPQRLGLGVALSPPVARALPELLERIVAEARALEFHFRRKVVLDAAPHPREPSVPAGLGL